MQITLILFICLFAAACRNNIAYEKNDSSISRLTGFASGLPSFDETAAAKYENKINSGYFYSCIEEDIAAFCVRHPENDGCNKYCHNYYIAVHLVPKNSTSSKDIRQLNFPMSKKGICQRPCEAEFENSPAASYIDDTDQDNRCMCFNSTEEKIAYYASLLKKYNLYT
jgi:hypothetical protein